MKFAAAFPTVEALASASEEAVFKLWQGLGYYSRARNLHRAAQLIKNDLNGSFPTSYETILKLPGVGPYTAAAIASFAFDEPKAVLDGNVFRVLARFFGIEDDIASPQGRKKFERLANEVLDKNKPACFNQAIMDFGATVCKPVSPACSKGCPLQKNCAAFSKKIVSNLPVKRKAAPKRERYFHLFVIDQKNGSVWLRRRDEKDIWQGLFELPTVETDRLQLDEANLRAMAVEHFGLRNFEVKAISPPRSQTLSHLIARAVFVEIETSDEPVFMKSGHQKWLRSELKNAAFSKLIADELQRSDLYLDLRSRTSENLFSHLTDQ